MLFEEGRITRFLEVAGNNLTTMTGHVPKHVAIIMDGNGRWAKEKGKPRLVGHKQGAKTAKHIITYALKYGISSLSLFAFGRDNWSRPPTEVNFLMELFVKTLATELEELTLNGVRLRFIGDRGGLSEKIVFKMRQAESRTQHNQALSLNIVFNYSGKWDITRAVKHIAEQCLIGNVELQKIDEEYVANSICLNDLPSVDLFIRTSAEYRISNFFLWQIAYAEMYFCEPFWPDFDEKEFKRALVWYQGRERRFGKTSDQIRGDADA